MIADCIIASLPREGHYLLQEVFDGEVRLIFGSEKFFDFPMSAYT